MLWWTLTSFLPHPPFCNRNFAKSRSGKIPVESVRIPVENPKTIFGGPRTLLRELRVAGRCSYIICNPNKHSQAIEQALKHKKKVWMSQYLPLPGIYPEVRTPAGFPLSPPTATDKSLSCSRSLQTHVRLAGWCSYPHPNTTKQSQKMGVSTNKQKITGRPPTTHYLPLPAPCNRNRGR